MQMIYPLLPCCLGEDDEVIGVFELYRHTLQEASAVQEFCVDRSTQQLHAYTCTLCCCSAQCSRCPTAVQMMRVELTKFNKRFGIAKMAAKAYIGKDMCCEAELTLVMGR